MVRVDFADLRLHLILRADVVAVNARRTFFSRTRELFLSTFHGGSLIRPYSFFFLCRESLLLLCGRQRSMVQRRKLRRIEEDGFVVPSMSLFSRSLSLSCFGILNVAHFPLCLLCAFPQPMSRCSKMLRESRRRPSYELRAYVNQYICKFFCAFFRRDDRRAPVRSSSPYFLFVDCLIVV